VKANYKVQTVQIKPIDGHIHGGADSSAVKWDNKTPWLIRYITLKIKELKIKVIKSDYFVKLYDQIKSLSLKEVNFSIDVYSLVITYAPK